MSYYICLMYGTIVNKLRSRTRLTADIHGIVSKGTCFTFFGLPPLPLR